MACPSTFIFNFLLIFLFFVSITTVKGDKGTDNEAKNKWKKKSIIDYNDADIERLYDQWEDADDDELEEDEKPEWKREPPKVDMSKLDMKNPESMLQMTKKGKTIMMFATVSGNPTQDETEKITQIWQGSLFNANYETQRYVVSEDRIILMLKDGSKAWEIKDFLVSQERCAEVTIEGKSYPGKGASGEKKDEKDQKNKKDTKDSNKTKKDKKGTKDKDKVMDNSTTKKKKTGKKEEL